MRIRVLAQFIAILIIMAVLYFGQTTEPVEPCAGGVEDPAPPYM